MIDANKWLSKWYRGDFLPYVRFLTEKEASDGEGHHALPQEQFPDWADDPGNIIVLLPSDHVEAHSILRAINPEFRPHREANGKERMLETVFNSKWSEQFDHVSDVRLTGGVLQARVWKNFDESWVAVPLVALRTSKPAELWMYEPGPDDLFTSIKRRVTARHNILLWDTVGNSTHSEAREDIPAGWKGQVLCQRQNGDLYVKFDRAFASVWVAACDVDDEYDWMNHPVPPCTCWDDYKKILKGEKES